MPEKETIRRAKQDEREGKAPSTQAGEFVHEEIEHVRQGKHGARSPQQAIAIGLSKARRAGIPLRPPAKGKTKETTQQKAERDYREGQAGKKTKPTARASRARKAVLEHEPRGTASHRALSRQSADASGRRSKTQRQSAAKKAVRTKGPVRLREAARKAARTRRRKAA